MKIIFSQGNPEPEYTLSRHNVGFTVLNTIAENLGAKWLDKPKFHAVETEVTISDEKVLLVKPTTFYNETSIAALKYIYFYKIDQSSDFLVIHDDLALPFGTIRVRQQGGDGGNNGIKSLNSHINPNYSRIRIGIDNEVHQKIADTDFVLGQFSATEAKQIEKTIIPNVIEIVEKFCAGTIEPTSYKDLE